MSTTAESLLCKEIEPDRDVFLLVEVARGGEDWRRLSFLVVGGVSIWKFMGLRKAEAAFL